MHDWFGVDWPKLKKQVVILCVSHADALFETERPEVVSINRFQTYCSVLLQDISRRSKQDELGMWQEALPLFVSFSPFFDTLNRDLQNIKTSTDISAKQIFGQALRFFLEDARRELVSAEIGETPARLKTWERLDRLSREIAKQAGITERCTEAHFEALLKRINEKFKANYNYPHKLTTIRGLFFKLSKVCRDLVTHVDGLEIERYSEPAVASSINPVLFGEHEQEALYQCLSELKDEEFELLDMMFKLGIHSVQYLSEKNFREAKGYTPRMYRQAKGLALESLMWRFEKRLVTAEHEDRP